MSDLHYLPLINSNYFNSIDNLDSKEAQNAIKIALMMVQGFRDILNDLNFDEEKLRELQFDLDDSYDVVEKIYKECKDKDTKELLDSLLTQMTKLDMEIGDFILEQKYASWIWYKIFKKQEKSC